MRPGQCKITLGGRMSGATTNIWRNASESRLACCRWCHLHGPAHPSSAKNPSLHNVQNSVYHSVYYKPTSRVVCFLVHSRESKNRLKWMRK